jgi:histidinol-phosphate aminotransferase
VTVIKPHIAQLAAYKPPLEGRDPDKFTLLDFNERTIPVAEPITQALLEYITSGRLQMYPSYGDIDQQLARYCGVSADQVMITNGSDHGIELIIRAVATSGSQAIIPGPTFAMYRQVATVEGMNIVAPEYEKGQGYPLAEVLAAITPATKLIVAASPNNPCGTPVTNAEIIALAEAAPDAAILVDECYYEYTQASATELINRYDNIFITRTFSKTWGIPSLRFGYIIAQANNVGPLTAMRGPYDINQLAVVAARAALANPESVNDYVREIMTVSKPALEAFLDAHDIEYWPSVANYILLFPKQPLELQAVLEQAGILVRPRSDSLNRVGLRVTIGTQAQTERFIAVVQKFLG